METAIRDSPITIGVKRSFLRILTQDQRSFGVSENFKIKDRRSSRGSKNLKDQRSRSIEGSLRKIRSYQKIITSLWKNTIWAFLRHRALNLRNLE